MRPAMTTQPTLVPADRGLPGPPAPDAWSTCHAIVEALQDVLGALAAALAELPGEPAGWSPGTNLNALRAVTTAVAAGDVAAFADTTHRLTGTPVRLRGPDGAVLAESVPGGSPAPDTVRHEVVLRDGGAVRGTLEIAAHHLAPMLADLATAMLRACAAADERDSLRRRLAVLGWIGPGVEWSEIVSAAEAPRPARRYRPVVVTTREALVGGAADRLHRALAGRAAGDLVLDNLTLVTADGMLVGLYPDDGPCDRSPEEQRRAWSWLVGAAPPGIDPMVSVGRAAAMGAALREQYRRARVVARLQHHRSDTLHLPRVAVAELLGPVPTMLLAGDGDVAPFVEGVLGDLLVDRRVGGQLADTLLAHLRSGGSLRATGEALHLHPSSVKYRMGIVRELLGGGLADADRRFEIELALRLHLAARTVREHAAALGTPDVRWPSRQDGRGAGGA